MLRGICGLDALRVRQGIGWTGARNRVNEESPMNAMKIAAPALLLGLALTATPALAQQSSKGDRFGRPTDRPPVNARNCSLSRSCSPGPYASVIPYISAGRKKSGTLSPATVRFGK